MSKVAYDSSYIILARNVDLVMYIEPWPSSSTK